MAGFGSLSLFGQSGAPRSPLAARLSALAARGRGVGLSLRAAHCAGTAHRFDARGLAAASVTDVLQEARHLGGRRADTYRIARVAGRRALRTERAGTGLDRIARSGCA